MALRIFNNLSSINARRSVSLNSTRFGDALSRISSGSRIQRSRDDAGGLVLSENLRSDKAALQQASKNANDGQAMISTAEGGLNEIANTFVRLRELANQAATGTVSDIERLTLSLEFEQFKNEITAISNSVEFNGQKLLNGELTAASTNKVILQIGLDSGENSRFNLSDRLDIGPITTQNLGLEDAVISSQGDALQAVEKVDAAVDAVSTIRAKVGAVQLQLGHAISNLNTAVESLSRADSIVRDADLGAELAELTKRQLLLQSGVAMVGQANLRPQAALFLLGN